MNNIAKFPLKLIKNIAIFIALFLSFIAVDAYEFKGEMQNPSRSKVTLRFAISKEEQTKGLSGIRPEHFKNNEGMLFINSNIAPRKFWMPDTYFPLDIIFLDDQIRIVGISKNAPAHPGMTEPPEIFKTDIFLAQYVLETKANSIFSKNLKIGDQLTFLGKTNLLEIISKTRPGQ